MTSAIVAQFGIAEMITSLMFVGYCLGIYSPFGCILKAALQLDLRVEDTARCYFFCSGDFIFF